MHNVAAVPRAPVEVSSVSASPHDHRPGNSPGQPPGRSAPPETPFAGVRRILVATDFSPAAAKAVERAASLAQQSRAALCILHVIDINAQPDGLAAAGAESLMRRLWAEGAGHLARLGGSLGDRVQAQTVLEEGLPWEQIVERSRQFDLVVLARPRQRGWRLFSQHTTQRVVQHAACPVLVVNDEK